MNTDLSSKIAKMLQDKHRITCDNRTAKRVALAVAYAATEGLRCGVYLRGLSELTPEETAERWYTQTLAAYKRDVSKTPRDCRGWGEFRASKDSICKSFAQGYRDGFLWQENKPCP